MGFKMLALSDKWGPLLVSKPETGMGYQIVTVTLRDGEIFTQAVVESGFVTKVRGYKDIPFKEEDIADIIVTHDKWDFKTES
jgi:hypothetical protein